MQPGKRSLIRVQEFEKLGLIRDAWKLPNWFSKLKPTDALGKNLATEASAESLREAKAVRAALEAKRAEACSQARATLMIPR